MRICRKCGSLFDPPYCKKCKKLRNDKHRAANREKYRAANRKWYADNPEKMKAAMQNWKKNNPEKFKAAQERWRKNNPDAFRLINSIRRSRKKANGGSLSKNLVIKLFKLQKGKCSCCGLPLGDNYHLDHIMPIRLGGPSEDWNMQLLRQRCNLQKKDKHPVDFMRSRGFLI